MSKVWKWILSRKRTLPKYEEAKEEFEKIIGRPSIRLVVELPPELDNYKDEFKGLEQDRKFTEALQKFVESYLKERIGKLQIEEPFKPEELKGSAGSEKP
ncbi:TPA: hypothetical protein EYP70_03675 [Candidatus Bathyarchaeota archaeon]|nr:hypothetical protein [Candidatus Bathyarchaeota archaeon]